MNTSIFREYDIRGVVETDLTPDVVENLGKAFGTRVVRGGGKKVAIGRDIRLTGESLTGSLSKGLLSAGCDIVDVGQVPTPILYFAHYHLDVDAGIMITGSHNPPEYNGFKLLINKQSVHGKEIQSLMEDILKGDFAKGEGVRTEADVIDPYMEMVKSKITLNRKIMVAIDSANGCGGLVAPELFKAMGCDVLELFSDPDGTFPNHHPDPTVEENMFELKRVVRESGAELGIGYDGDADRIGIIDDQGNQLHGDQILMIFAKDLLSRKKRAKVIFDVKCTQNLPEYIKKYGGEPIMSATGHSIIKQRLSDENADLAGEMSAHIFFTEDYFGFDDAIFATAKFLSIVDREEAPVSELLSDVPEMVSTPEIRIDCPDDEKFEIVKELVEYFRGKYSVIDIDGVRMEFGNGWGLIRASNTQPVLVLRFESETLEQLNQYKLEVYEKLITYDPLKNLEPF
jgi:phosphomannomutase/phosphoglucomutase